MWRLYRHITDESIDFTFLDGWTIINIFLFTADIRGSSLTKSILQCGVGVLHKKIEMILAQTAAIWSLNQNISILRKRKLTAQTVKSTLG